MPDCPIIDAHPHTYPRPEIGWQAQAAPAKLHPDLSPARRVLGL